MGVEPNGMVVVVGCGVCVVPCISDCCIVWRACMCAQYHEVIRNNTYKNFDMTYFKCPIDGMKRIALLSAPNVQSHQQATKPHTCLTLFLVIRNYQRLDAEGRTGLAIDRARRWLPPQPNGQCHDR
jgi:hypothetical protein